MTSMTPRPDFEPLRDYADGRRMLGWALVAFVAAAATFVWTGWTGWLSLTVRLWLAYSAGHVALWLHHRRGRALSWPWVIGGVLGTTLAASLAGLPLAPDFVADRLRSPSWLLQRIALPLGFGLAMHLPALVLRAREWQQHRQRIAAAESEAARSALQRQVTLAELRTLQAQVEPHFLYNTLASVQSLVRRDPARADEMLDHLHEHLRQSLPAMRSEQSTLGREAQLARSYLSIMRIRMDDRLAFRIDVPDDLAHESFPPMMLSTLVENAIKHGIEPSTRGGTVVVSAERVPQGLAVSVVDDGVGLGASTATSGSGLGLSNVRERLRALFGEQASLRVESRDTGGVQACITVPAAH
ncbi:sensor histidine kinase [Piscinibacter terrae]|uniref:Sensor histidine kinase n=1 Tax=Piscinibacter terrae TaxID=2496871 RepID=A0A3N7HSM1_9BURK|nr:sensor histidine kinase [Albitalea terrae]RQP24246.1 sensor histidine kinase [Albitalea terrae]